jgi:hypothetical protein
MRVLEARFRSSGVARGDAGAAGSDDFVVVGRIVWEHLDPAADPVIQADPALQPNGSPPLVEKLRYLVSAMAPDSYQRLQTLQSRFWSFVDVTGVEVTGHTEKGGP